MKKIQEKERKKMGQKLEKFLGMRKIEGGPCYKEPKKEVTSHIFKQLVCNLKIYNGIKL